MNYTNVTTNPIETVADNAALLGVAVVFIYVAIILIHFIIMGVLCKKLAKKKGYRGYFWTGFFLSVIGLIYVVGLPVKKKTRTMEE